jgi:hypothetical protein
MPDPAASRPPGKRAKDPNFPLVVAISGVVLLLFFVAAWLVIHHSGRKLVPQVQHDNEPHSYLIQPDSGRAFA